MRNAQSIRKYSRKPRKAHTHKKRQPTNAAQERCTRLTKQHPNQGAIHASNHDNTLVSSRTLAATHLHAFIPHHEHVHNGPVEVVAGG